MGGEKFCPGVTTNSLKGSPPHGRGKGHACHQAAVVVGITPAWAGKRGYTYTGCNSYEDHPRMGGEKTLYSGMQRVVLGSPPRRRGKAADTLCTMSLMGFTPADAGGKCISA